jgi:hypothetical protein
MEAGDAVFAEDMVFGAFAAICRRAEIRACRQRLAS